MKVRPFRSTIAAAALLAFGASLHSAAGREADAVLFGGIVDYGLYDPTDGPCDNAVPIGYCSMITNRHMSTTTTVPACLGITFGFRFRVPGLLLGAPVAIREVVVFPPAGIRNPAYPVPAYTYARNTTCDVGVTCSWASSFDYPWELVPGVWKFEIWSGGQLIATKTFNVVAVANSGEARQDGKRREAGAEPCQPANVS